MQPIPLTDQEAALEPFWIAQPSPQGNRRDPLEAYEQRWHPQAGGRTAPPCRILIERPAPEPGEPALSLVRSGQADLRGYDRIELCAAMPPHAWLSLRLTLDGKPRTLIEGLQGIGRPRRCTAKLEGRMLQGIRIELGLSQPKPAAVSLEWITLQRETTAAPPMWDPQWPGLLLPGSAESESAAPGGPTLGLFFDGEHLEALRGKLTGSGWLAPAYEALRRRAQRLMRIDPEAQVGRLCPPLEPPLPRQSAPAREASPDHETAEAAPRVWLGPGVMDALAFVGLIDQDPAMTRHAARLALALAHCEHWVGSARELLPGSLAQPPALVQAHLLQAMAETLDWAGHALTDYGRELLFESMLLKGLPRVEADLAHRPAAQDTALGLKLVAGLTPALIALSRRSGRSEAAHAVERLEERIDSAIANLVRADGGLREGAATWLAIETVMPALALLRRQQARQHHERSDPQTLLGEPADLGESSEANAELPQRLAAAARYALSMRSSVEPGSGLLPLGVARGSTRFSPAAAALLARALPETDWHRRYAAMLPNRSHEELSEPRHLILAPASAPAATPRKRPALLSLHESGQVCSVRQEPALGTVLLHLSAGPSPHQDRGSLLLEAGGEALLIDRGEPAGAAESAAAAWAHNLLCPEQPPGRPMSQQAGPHVGGRLVSSLETGGMILVACECAAAWADPSILSLARRLISPRPGLVIVDDELTLSEDATPMPAAQRWHTTLSPELRRFSIAGLEHKSWRLKAQRLTLDITPINWRPIDAEVRPEGLDRLGRRVHCLRLGSPSGHTHRCLTALQLQPLTDQAEASAEDTRAEQPNAEPPNPDPFWRLGPQVYTSGDGRLTLRLAPNQLTVQSSGESGRPPRIEFDGQRWRLDSVDG